MRSYLATVLSFILFFLCCQPVSAEMKLVFGVEDKDWGGHYRWVDGQLKGIDADIVRRVAAQLGYKVEFAPYPWKRVLKMAERKEIDGVLNLAPTKQRKRFLYFVSTPISEETSVFWVRRGSRFEFSGTFYSSMRLGLLRGSDWSDRFAKQGKPEVVLYDSYKAAFNSLVEQRIDAFGGHLAPTREYVVKLGYIDKIEAYSYMFKGLPYFIAFSDKPGHVELAKTFSKALQTFFFGPEYQELLDEYGVGNSDRVFYPPKL
jgi:polar amino acid transport system substrate-binding protein